jgi:hypothetical protein
MAPDGDLSHIGEWVGKAAGLAVRLAGILHLADNARDLEPWAKPIGADSARRGIDLVESYFLPHALAAFDLMGASESVDLARHALRWIQRNGESRFKRSMLHKNMHRRVRDPDEWTAPLKLLAKSNYIAPTNGSKAREFDVNPAVLMEGGAA